MRPCRWICLVAIVAGIGCSARRDVSIIDEFRASERATLRTFNDALRRQRANEIDEIGLADAIDNAVLPRWRGLRSRVTSASELSPHSVSESAALDPSRDEQLHIVLRRYLANRQQAWEAYSAALRSPTDEAARLHYANYHALDAAAVEDARILGTAFRKSDALRP